MEENKKKIELAAILRKKAEDELIKNTLPPDSNLTDIEILKLIHELDVHQIELEMQNEELVLAKKKAKIDAEKYINLYDFAPSGYITLSQEGEIRELNLKAASILGKERFYLKNRRLALFISDQTRAIFNLFLEQIIDHKSKETCEVIIAINPDQHTYVLLTGVPSENGEQCLLTMVDISQRKKAEEETKISNEKYKTLFESNRDSIVLFRMGEDGKPTNFIEANSATTRIFGFTKEELLTLNIKQLESTTEKKRKARIEILQSEGKIDFETIIKNNKGNKRNVEVEVSIINYQNEPAVMNIIRDITERKQDEENARKVFENLESILGAIPDLLFEVGYDGRIYHYQSHNDELLSFSADQFLGKNFQDVFPVDATNIIRSAIQEANEKGWSNGKQYSLDLPNGEFWFELSVSPIKGGIDKDTHFILLARNITDRKKTEQELRKSQEKLRGIFDLANSGIILTDLEGNYLLFNNWVTETLGYTRLEMNKLTQKEIVHPDDFKKSKLLFDEVIKGEINRSRLETRFIRKDKSFFWGEISISAIKDTTNKTVNTVGIITDITRRKEAENKLIENANFLIQTQINAKIGSYSLDFNTQKWLSTPALDIVFGIDTTFDKSIQGWQSLIHPDWKIYLDNYLKNEVLVNKNNFNVEYKAIKADTKEDIWVHGLGKIIYDENKEVSQLIGTIQDITDKKNAEEKMRESEDKYRGLVEGSPDGIVLYSEEKIVYINDEGLHMMGAKNRSDLIGKPISQFIHPDSQNSIIQRMKDLNVNEFASKTVEEKFIDLKGNTIDVEIKAIPTIFEKKAAIQVIVHNITERKNNQEKIRQLSQAVEQSPVTILITNKKGEIEYVNPKFTETSGYRFDEIVGQNNRFLKSGYTSKEEYKQLWQTLADGKEWHGEFHNKKKNGELYWESASISPIVNAQGKITHFIAIKEDITNRKIAEQELVKAKNKAEESDRLKLAFLANMSHEIRTPMNGILGFTELLKEPKLTGEEQQEYIKIIEKSGKRMLNIINDIINISKVESGQIDVSLSETNVNEQLEYLNTFFKPETKLKGIELIVPKKLSPKECMVSTDKEKIYAILTNLIKNAIKFTVAGSIEFGCERKGENIEFFVKDTGSGIPKSQQKMIFERFRQANETITRTHEGSGLGLAISKAYVEMLEGKIWVESEEGKGSTFFFTIPFKDGFELEKETKINKKTPKENEVNIIKDLKVLIVEDDAISKLLITIGVKPYSKEIIKVSTGIEAIEACHNNPDIDLVMMDINMPEMGGYEATKQIRKFNKDLVIIAQTANGMQSDREDAIAAGCTDYISKPVNIKSLGSLIQKYFKK